MTIEVIDNCLHKEVFDELVAIAMQVPYRFQLDTAYEKAKDTPSFSCLYTIEELANNGTKIIEKEPLGTAVAQIVKNAVLNAGMPFKGIGRVRFAILPQSLKSINAPHIDFYLPHKVGLIYLNDSDGETVFYNEKINWNGLNPDNMTEHFKKPVTIERKIKPKKNRMVLFDGEQLHSSTNPKDYKFRMALNFNYV